MLYAGRPGLSPAIAALITAGTMQKRHKILDVGCGTGTDALLLARWGFKHVQGVDPDARAIGTARSRASRARLAKRVQFRHLGAEELTKTFPVASFDIVLHTLVANNLTKHKGKHFHEVASVMKPEGILIMHERVGRRYENSAPNRFPALPAVRKYFVLSDGIATQLAEHHAGRKGPSYARVVFWIGRPRT